MLVLAVFFAISISASFAQTAGDYRSVGTGDWTTLATWERYNGPGWATPTVGQGWPGQLAVTGAVNILAGHTVSILASGISTLPMGTLTISGALNLDGDNSSGGIDFSLNTQNVIVTQNLTPTPANILFNQKSNLRLPVNATIYVGASGLTTSNCSNQPSIYIGPTQYYTCAGGGSACAKFEDLMTNGGNQTITLTSGSGTNNQTNCIATSIQEITYAVNGSTGANIAWLPSIPTGLTGNYNAGVYTITGTPTVSGTFNYAVTTIGPGTCTNATASGTITIAAGTPPTTTGITICQGGSGSLTSSFTCPAGGNVTSVLTNAGIGTNGVGPGTIAWSNPGNITTPIGSPYATVNLNPLETSEYIQGKNYSFSIPANATINGISVTIKRQCNFNLLFLGFYDVDLNLLKNGIIVGTDKASATAWPTSMGVVSYGGASDLWGTTWTAAEINNANFGVSLSVLFLGLFTSQDATIDYMQISVTYTVPPATLDWYTLPSGGTKIGSGSPFNPAGVLNSGLANTNTAGTTTYYAECSTSPGCRTATDFIITPSQPASVSISASANPVCTGIPVTFTATPTNEGAAPIYQWKVNNVNVGSNNPLYSYTPTDGDIINCVLISNATCATGSPATSNGVTIAIVPPVGPIIFNMGASSTRYQVAGKVTYTATALNNTGITYSLDASSLAGGNSIVSATGEVTYILGWSGTSIITATVSGCPAQTTATHTVATMTTTIGTTWCFSLFTKTGALTCAGASTIAGDIGTNTGAISGFAGKLTGTSQIYSPTSPEAIQAGIDVVTAYNDLAATPCGQIIPGIAIAGVTTLTPDVYCLGGALTIDGELILDGQGDPNALFIFKVNGALTTNTLSKIKLINSASLYNVYWRVYGAVVLSGDEFNGTIVNDGAITLNTGAALNGRALSINGAIALTDNIVSGNCSPIISVPDNIKPTFTPPPDISECVENLADVVYNPLTTAINPDRPDFYTFSFGDTRLDLNTTLFTDDKPLTCTPITIRWIIDYSLASDLNSPYNLVIRPSLTGSGKPSEIIGGILFPGDGVNFTTVVHHITWWIKDCDGYESLPQTRSIIINPRPKIQ